MFKLLDFGLQLINEGLVFIDNFPIVFLLVAELILESSIFITELI